jgi:hypothetical protein
MTKSLEYIPVTVQINVFMLDAAPQPLDKNIIEYTSAPIHADRDAFALEHAREGVARESRSLVAVEYFRLAVHVQCVFQAVHTERRFHAVADAPTENLAAVPVDYGHLIRETVRQPK